MADTIFGANASFDIWLTEIANATNPAINFAWNKIFPTINEKVKDVEGKFLEFLRDPKTTLTDGSNTSWDTVGVPVDYIKFGSNSYTVYPYAKGISIGTKEWLKWINYPEIKAQFLENMTSNLVEEFNFRMEKKASEILKAMPNKYTVQPAERWDATGVNPIVAPLNAKKLLDVKTNLTAFMSRDVYNTYLQILSFEDLVKVPMNYELVDNVLVKNILGVDNLVILDCADRKTDGTSEQIWTKTLAIGYVENSPSLFSPSATKNIMMDLSSEGLVGTPYTIFRYDTPTTGLNGTFVSVPHLILKTTYGLNIANSRNIVLLDGIIS